MEARNAELTRGRSECGPLKGLRPHHPATLASEDKIIDAAEQWQKLTAKASERHGYFYGQQKDLSRVLRLPGSINRKAGLERPCRVIEASGVLHPWE